MALPPLLIVGLGNPGREYAASRHNVGWMVVDELSSELGTVDFRKKFCGDFAKTSIEGRDCFLLKPGTYMNESGRSVQPAVHFYDTAPEDLLVLHDELDLPFGEVRLKLGGGHAGHNGLRSIIQHLGTADFVRVRIGIGHAAPGFAGDTADYVLSSFGPDERAGLPDVVAKAAAVVRRVAGVGPARAMNEVNTRSKAPAAEGSGPQGGADCEDEAEERAGAAAGAPGSPHVKASPAGAGDEQVRYKALAG